MWHNALTPITNRDKHLPENRSSDTENNEFCESSPWFKGWKVNKTLAILGWLISYLSTLKKVSTLKRVILHMMIILKHFFVGSIKANP
jgi:hypothetical protein